VVKAAVDKLAPPPSNDFDSFPLLKLIMNGLNRQNLFLSVKKNEILSTHETTSITREGGTRGLYKRGGEAVVVRSDMRSRAKSRCQRGRDLTVREMEWSRY
jgi:hypothetical protein